MPLAALVAVTLIAALVAGAIAWRYPRAPGATVELPDVWAARYVEQGKAEYVEKKTDKPKADKKK